jgi:hypothetical protein
MLAAGAFVVAALAVALVGRGRSRAPASDAETKAAAPAEPERGGGAPAPEPPPSAPGGLAAAAAPAAAAGQAHADAPRGHAPTAAEVDALNEAVLMARLRGAGGTDAALAIELARAGNRRFPDSPDAPERTSILIHALVSVGRPNEARGVAEEMVNHYPDSSWVREVEQFTGAHRHRNVRVNDAGALEFYDP